MVATFNPLHGVRDRSKLAALVESLRAGRPVPAVAVIGGNALTGSHRVAAFEAAWKAWDRREAGWVDSPEPVLETVEVSDVDYAAACQLLGIDNHGGVEHFDLFAAALYAVTDDEALRAALADQRGEYEECDRAYFAWYASNH